MSEVKAILEPTKKDNYKSLHLNNFDRQYLVDNNKDIKMSDIKYIIFISDLSTNRRIIFTQLKLGI